MDLDSLRDALQLRRRNAIRSKEVGVGILAAAGMALSPWTFPSGVVAIAALENQAANYRADRRKIMTGHAISWLMEPSDMHKRIKPL